MKKTRNPNRRHAWLYTYRTLEPTVFRARQVTGLDAGMFDGVAARASEPLLTKPNALKKRRISDALERTQH